MIVNHLNFSVADVPANRDLFEKYLGFRNLVDRGELMSVSADDAGTTLVLLNFKDTEPVSFPNDIASFHIGFNQNNKQVVDQMYEQLTGDGFEVDGQPRNAHGAWTFYLKAPAGFYIEIFHQQR